MANQTNKTNKVIDLFSKLIIEHGSETLKNILVGDEFQAQLNAAVGKKQPKKPKKVLDPTAPKRPTTTWRLFCSDTRDELREKNPGLKMSEITALQSPMWTALQASEKPDDIRKIEDYKAIVAVEKEAYQIAKGGGKAAVAAPPKPPKNSYQLFMKEERHKYKEDGDTFGTTTKKLAAAWKQLKLEDPERVQSYSDRVKSWSLSVENTPELSDPPSSAAEEEESEPEDVANSAETKLQEDIDIILSRLVEDEDREEQEEVVEAVKKQRRPKCKAKKATVASSP